ncbi:MAG: magnesium transporter [Pygmaiobacter massiliensis]|nr:magnesium transporter [Pygmaiobacter massiliensis]
METRKFDDQVLLELIDRRNFKQLRQALDGMNEVDVATFIEQLPREKMAVVFRTLPKTMAADVFSNLEPESQQIIIDAITDQELSIIIDDLFVDDAVDMLEELPANVVKRVLKNAAPDTRQLINQFLKYPENSAGSIMTAEFTDLRATMTVKEAISHIRRTGQERETIYTCYVIDSARHLEGVTTVKDLLLAKDDELVANLMDTDVIAVHTMDDQEEVVHILSKYDFLALPVVDHESRLVGIITIDDAIDVMEQETTEDFEKMGGMIPSEKPYLKTGVVELAKNRIVWLLVLMISGLITGGILGRFEETLAAMPILVTFVTMLTGTGGNAGSQSSTLIIRGLATGEIKTSDLFAVLWKELRVSTVIGLILAAANYLRVVIMYPGQSAVALVVAVTMFFVIVMAKTIGGMLPIVTQALGADPALMAAPLLTTVVDAAALLVYFAVAFALLPI